MTLQLFAFKAKGAAYLMALQSPREPEMVVRPHSVIGDLGEGTPKWFRFAGLNRCAIECGREISTTVNVRVVAH